MNRKWYKAEELAGLNGLPQTKRRILSKAAAEGWKSRKLPSRGRTGFTLEYHIDSLPPTARADLMARQACAGSAAQAGLAGVDLLLREEKARSEERDRARQAGLARYAQLPAEQQLVADARFALLGALSAFIEGASLKKGQGTRLFIRRLLAGDIPLEEAHREALSKCGNLRVSAPTIARWRKALDEGGLAALATNYQGRSGSRTLTGPMQQLCIAMLVEHFNTNPQFHHRAIAARFPGEEAPSLQAIRRFITTWIASHESYYLRLKNPDKWRSAAQFAVGDQAEGIERLNQRWEMDSTPADLLLSDGSRYNIIGCIDIYSRRLKLHLSPTSQSQAIAALIRKCLLDWGTPEEIKTDNGKDYVANYLEHVLFSLSIEHLYCTPFEPQQKPFIERALGTFSHDLVELMPGFIGHSVAERKDVEARRAFSDRMMNKDEEVELRLGPDELQAIMDKWTAGYHERTHSGLGEKRPNELVASWREPVRRIENERALDVLLAPLAGERTIGKKGIRVDHRYYAAPELAGHELEKVLVKLDPTDLSRVYVFTLENIFLAVAIDPTAPNVDRAEFASRVRNYQRQVIGEGTRELKKSARAQSVKGIGREILEEEAARIGNLERFPGPSVSHVATALEQSAEAVRARDLQDNPQHLEATAEEIAAADELLGQTEAARSAREEHARQEEARLLEVDFPAAPERPRDSRGKPLFVDDSDKYEWIYGRLLKGAPVDDDEREWMRRHELKTFGKVMTDER